MDSTDRTLQKLSLTAVLVDAPGQFNAHAYARNATNLLDEVNQPMGDEEPEVDRPKLEAFFGRIYRDLVVPYSAPGKQY